ncbi:MAG: type II toxin-antitoxin system Phd/YefM family antitoxin [Clostridiales bacterium]|nr:type II toxin-antitoxin system Phd/YefM family antitoxin [Clostridiales bacterium]
MITVTATEMQNNFGEYLKLVQNGNEIMILKNGKEAARMVSLEQKTTVLTNALRGILKNDYDEKEMRKEQMKKYENIG